jgi:ribonuclease R
MTPLMQRILNALQASSSQALNKTKLTSILNIKGVEPRRAFKEALKELKHQGFIHIESRKLISLSSIEKKEPDAIKKELSERDDALFDQKSSKDFLLGVYDEETLSLHAVERKNAFPPVKVGDTALSHGNVVRFLKNKSKEIIQCVGHIHNPHDFPTIACLAYDIPHAPHKDPHVSKTIEPSPHHKDLTHFPFVTIDGETARDFDDAVYAMPLDHGNYRLFVAIADVSYYVPAGSDMDKEAFNRGNSVYFPGTMIPMLPEALACDLCSLNPGVPRLAMVFRADISSQGRIFNESIGRAVIQSHRRFTYEEVQEIIDGIKAQKTDSFPKDAVNYVHDLYEVHGILKTMREKRGSLDIDSPEYVPALTAKGFVEDISLRARLESHILIENMMIAANEGVAKLLKKKGIDHMYRVHEEPTLSRLVPLDPILKLFGLKLGKKSTQHHFNKILRKAAHTPQHFLINELILRAQARARYTPAHQGHFGLGLEHYAHFTSPIRRYADLVVHRALVGAFGLGEGGYLYDLQTLHTIGDHISKTERLADQAERFVMEHLLAHYVKKKVGQVFTTTITGLSPRGLFLRIDALGLEGFLPVSDINDDFYIFDEKHMRFFGKRTHRALQLGDTLQAQMTFVNVYDGSVRFLPVLGKAPSRARKNRSEKEIFPKKRGKKEAVKKEAIKKEDAQKGRRKKRLKK